MGQRVWWPGVGGGQKGAVAGSGGEKQAMVLGIQWIYVLR